MDKQRLAWIVLIVAGAVMAGLWFLNRKATEDRLPRQGQGPPRAAAPTSAPATQPATASVGTRPSAGAPSTAAAPDAWQQLAYDNSPRGKYLAGSLDPKSGYLFQIEFARWGAAVNTVKLAQTFATVADKKLYDRLGKDHAKYLAALAAAPPERYKGHYSLLNPAGKYLPYATRSIVLGVKEEGRPETHNVTIPLDTIQWDYKDTKAVTQPAQGMEITFAAALACNPDPARPEPSLRLTKTYRVVKNDYSLQMRLKVENLTSAAVTFYVDQLGPTGVPLEELYRNQDDRFVAWGKFQSKDSAVEVVQRQQTEIMARSEGAYRVPSDVRIGLGRSDEAEPALWVAHANKFFASILYLRPTVEQRLQAAAWQADFHYLASPESPTSRTFVAAMRIGGKRPSEESQPHVPGLVLQPGKPKEMVFEIFAGPKKRDMFSNAAAPHYKPLYEKLNFLGTINFRSCFCAWNALTLGMMWLLQKISLFAFGNYGVAIMVLVVLVRVVLHPLTKKGQVNMMKMQKLQPEMARLRKKYADDKETLQKEMMKFYKHQGATPLLGCLPMFLQMPIWISLWGSLNAAVELRHAAFLPVWITDLAAPDALISWQAPVILPLIGGFVGPVRSFNLLPLLLTVAMFLQTKFNPQMSQPSAAASPEQEKQKKMMQVMMPAMMLLFFYNAASGLTLYIMTSTFAGVAEQFIIRKHIRAREAAEAAAVTTVKVPGKAARGSRPKKPKGPFFTKHG